MDELRTKVYSGRKPGKMRKPNGIIRSGAQNFEPDISAAGSGAGPKENFLDIGQRPTIKTPKKVAPNKIMGKEAVKSTTAAKEQSKLPVQERTKEGREPVQEVKHGKPGMSLQYMADEISKKVTMIVHQKNLYYYTGRTYWMIADEQELLRLIRASVSRDAFGTASTRRFSDLLSYLKADDHLIPHDYEKRLQKSRYNVVFKNGVLDLWTMELLPHSRNFLTFYELDAEWRRRPEPKRFNKFLEKISGGDAEIVLRIMEAIGYMVSPINEGKYFFAMGTAPNSGKSTLGTLIRKLIGDEFVSCLSTYHLGGRFALGNIQNKVLNMAMDLPDGKLNSVTVAVIKQITGGDMIATEQKYEKIRETHSGMRFLFASNYPIAIPKDEDDDSFWDRMVIIPFLYSISKAETDSKLVDKLLEEKDDIISYCLLALSGVLKRNCTFSNCGEADRMKANWRYCEFDSSATALPFVEESIEVTGNEQDGIYSQELYTRYQEFCTRNGEKGLSYAKLLGWLTSNLDGCRKKRIHHTGLNPMSGLVGIRWKAGSGDVI